jgi:hypothetical protein
MKTRDVIVLCAAMVTGAVSITGAEPVAAKLSAQTMMLAQATPAPAATKQAPAHTSKAKAVDADEARITDLHAKLKITPAQEDLWSSVTKVMRANAKTMEPLRQARYDKAPTMTAVEDFTSYAEIADAHADGIKAFVPVFTALYDSMSDAQKKNTDTIFRRGEGPRNTTSKGQK